MHVYTCSLGVDIQMSHSITLNHIFFCGWMIHGIISDDSVLVNLSVVWCFCRFLFRILFLPHRFVWLAVVLRSGSILGKAVVDKASVRTLLLWEGGSHDWSCFQGDVADSQTQCSWPGNMVIEEKMIVDAQYTFYIVYMMVHMVNFSNRDISIYDLMINVCYYYFSSITLLFFRLTFLSRQSIFIGWHFPQSRTTSTEDNTPSVFRTLWRSASFVI